MAPSFPASGIKKGHRHPLAFLGEAVPVQAQRALLGAFAGIFEADGDALACGENCCCWAEASFPLAWDPKILVMIERKILMMPPVAMTRYLPLATCRRPGVFQA